MKCINFVVLFLAAALPFCGPAPSFCEDAKSIVESSRYVSEVSLPSDAKGNWQAFAIRPDMFDGGRWDLVDLRLLDSTDKEVPYAMRVYLPRSVRQAAEARVFNRVTGPDGSVELSLDLGETPLDHNEVELTTAGSNFRRTAVLEGGSDGENWGKLAETKLLHATGVHGKFDEQRFDYAASRFRYLRVRVQPDPSVDKEPVEINAVVVRRVVEEPGEFVTRDAVLSPREPSRHEGLIGSSWLIDLGGSQVPCSRLEVEIEGEEFVRDYVISALPDAAHNAGAWDDSYRGGAYYPPSALNYDSGEAASEAAGPTLGEAFVHVNSTRGTFRRRAGEAQTPLVAEMGNVRAGKLRLFIADSANQALKVTSVKYTAPVCLAIVATSSEARGPLRAYFGNPQAPAPNYDFARNLPVKLDPPPSRLEAADRAENPAYIPPPLPFTERFRWLIHGVLGLVSLLLAALVIQLARRVMSQHDERAAATQSPAAQ